MTKTVANAFGYQTLANPPSENELAEYYSQRYYQNCCAHHAQCYSEEEKLYFYNKIERKKLIIEPLLSNCPVPRSLLDIGCGEGWALSFFLRNGWIATGLDYSRAGCEQHNPDAANHILTGDIFRLLEQMARDRNVFDCLWLDNIVEHVPDPKRLLTMLTALARENTVLMVEVPNDFSPLQNRALETGMIASPFWVQAPDHISYFNRQGLLDLANHCGWQHRDMIASFPIDFNLAHPDANYVQDKTKGKGAHRQRVFLDNLMHDISPHLANDYYRVLARMGLGRDLAVFFTLKPDDRTSKRP